ncbi:hypothetical protein VTI28DRAFT_7053 [Corynascus sepedonium]
MRSTRQDETFVLQLPDQQSQGPTFEPGGRRSLASPRYLVGQLEAPVLHTPKSLAMSDVAVTTVDLENPGT